jgi:hypothetical protein
MNSELREFLEKHPHLIPMQIEIDKQLNSIESQEGRLYYLSVEMFSSMYEMIDGLNELNEITRKIQL